MGLDMRPMGKPVAGFEQRFKEIFNIIRENENLSEKQRQALLNEWFENQIPSYETIKAPRGGRDPEADAWAIEQYNQREDKSLSLEEFLQKMKGYYVIELAKETDGVPCYISWGQDENVFRGQFMTDCIDIIGEDLVYEAWETKLAEDTLDYGNRLMQVADKLAKEHHLEYLKEQRNPPEDADEESMESKLHILFSLAKWLQFYGRNGHGYEADF